ncbi:hypothetical protein QE385_003978 [Sphingomonas sp. SORGH_AS 950]|uniref:hypothetical protein n=1 Tax=Sphingomonas sp. SORGH_AS_0950 TaxID=3041792 RepID=UPI00277F6DDD|nr:hypothetical protein [Sphingomonas sp. SORGH_AS_0950]MDQ1159581.1 hypothetical protein [Sphingomonas sp. SORGH_AS_0950]
MTRPLRIYLSGSIRKGAQDPRSPDHFWSHDDEEAIRSGVGSPVELLNPAKTDIRRQDFGLNFGCDLHLVSISDVMLVDARRAKGIGIGAEMMFAAQRGIPIITWAPWETHYRRSSVPDVFGEDLTDWIHPFVFGLSDHVVDELECAIDIIRGLARSEPISKTVAIGEQIDRYRRSIGFVTGESDERFVHVGGGVFQDLLGGGAETEMVDGMLRQRFMDVLYLPTDTAHLPHEALLSVNRWRERRLAKRPLLHSSRIRRVVAAAIRHLSDSPRVFEIGCGKFPIADDVACQNWWGLETDEEAVRHLAGRGLHAVTSPDQIRPGYLDADIAVALFSMQFAIDNTELGLLSKLPADALVAFNLPTRSDELVELRLRQFAELGFSTSILNLHPTGARDIFVLAGRPAAAARLHVARVAALDAALIEWPSAGPELGWAELAPPIAHRKNVR